MRTAVLVALAALAAIAIAADVEHGVLICLHCAESTREWVCSDARVGSFSEINFNRRHENTGAHRAGWGKSIEWRAFDAGVAEAKSSCVRAVAPFCIS